MTGPQDDAARNRPRSPAVRQAWIRTTEDADAVAEDRRRNGWEVVSTPSLHTAPVSKSQGEDADRFGLVHVIPDNHADDVAEAFERGEFPQYQVYRNQVEGFVYLVTELLDPDTDTVILIASQYDGNLAKGLVRSAREEGAIYTHAKTIGGTELGRVRHEEIEPFLPDVE